MTLTMDLISRLLLVVPTLFGILLICAIVLPEQLRPFLSIGWRSGRRG